MYKQRGLCGGANNWKKLEKTVSKQNSWCSTCWSKWVFHLLVNNKSNSKQWKQEGGLLLNVFFDLQVDGPVTWGLISSSSAKINYLFIFRLETVMKVLHWKRTTKKSQPPTARKPTFQLITPLQTHCFVASVRYGGKATKLSYSALCYLIKVNPKCTHISVTYPLKNGEWFFQLKTNVSQYFNQILYDFELQWLSCFYLQSHFEALISLMICNEWESLELPERI